MSNALDDLLEESNIPTTTVLLDGDMVAYAPASVTDGRMYVVKGQGGAWKYKKDVVKFCEENDLPPEDISINFFPEPVEHALSAIKSTMGGIKKSLIKEGINPVFEVYLSGEGNFRFDINPTYKMNRDGVRRPEHLKACRDYLVKNHGAVHVDGMETDDMLTIRATELNAEGLPWVIASGDKDLKQMPGMHYDWGRDFFGEVTPEEARELLWGQVVIGDKTDNIHSPEGIGPAKAKALFKDVDWSSVEDEELFEMVTSLYCEYLGKEGKKKKKEGIKAVIDFTDVRCLVEEVYHQVFLLRERL
jgi:hypothetical protein